MPDGFKHRLGEQLRRLCRWLVLGPQFRRYALQNRAASAETPLHIAVPYLIPNLGDAVMLFPLLDALRQQNPAATISCFTYGSSRILREHPAVDHHYEVTTKEDWRAVFGRASYIHDLYRFWRSNCRSMRFHTVVMLRAGVDPFHSSHLGWMLGGSERCGYSSTVEPERASYDLQPDALLTRCIPAIGRVHEIERGSEVLEVADLLHAPVDLRLPVQSMLRLAHSPAGQSFVERYPELQKPYAVIAPGASFPRRRWAWESFSDVVQRTVMSRGWQVVLVGGTEDRELCQQLAASLPAHAAVLNLAGKTSFVELAAVCAGAQLFVGNDSGTGHVAGACGIPTVVVAMFRQDGPATHHSSPLRTHPAGPAVRVVQSPCQIRPCQDECEMDYAHCILGVTPEKVCAAVDAVLSAPVPILASSTK